MTTSCPKCGKPIRASARFCAACGSSISVTSGAKPLSSPYSSTSGTVCPKCKKPVSPNAKFCRNCGQAISFQAVQTSSTSQDPKAASPAAPSVKPISPQSPAQPPQATTTPIYRHKGLLGKLQTRKISKTILIGGGIIIGTCVLISIAVALWANRDKLVFNRITETPNSPLPMATFTSESPTVTATITETPSPTATSTPTATENANPSPTTTSTPTATENANPSPTATSSVVASPVVVFFEGFDAGWQDRWILWGTPLPTVSGTNSALVLDSQSGSSDSGATSQERISLAAGTIIQFEVRVDATQKVVFDWDPAEKIRQPGSGPGVIHLEIGNGQVIFQITRVGNTIAACQAIPMEDEYSHLYQVIVSGKYNPTFLIDGKNQCSLLDQVLIEGIPEGRVSFSGWGIVDNINILFP